MFGFRKRRHRGFPSGTLNDRSRMPDQRAWWQRWYWYALATVAVLAAVMIASVKISDAYALWDNDPDRGATTVAEDVFGDSYKTVKYLDQGWRPEESLWFYNTTQGSNLMPYDFFMVLEQPKTQKLFRSDEIINNTYRYLPRKKTFANPDALPVGFVKDNYLGKDYIGFTCAACHTGQFNYKGVGYRIDGGPAMSDLENFIGDLARALNAISCTPSAQGCDEPAKDRFVKNVLARGNYGSAKEVEDDLKKWNQRISMYYIINHDTTPYGFARLDAFGRIFNKVLEYVVDRPALTQALSELVGEEKLTQADFDGIMNKTEVKTILSGEDRDHIVERISQVLSLKQQLELRNKLFIPANAPVSYPFIWDAPQHDYVQWNGLAENAAFGALGRNTGEVIGVFGTMNWSRGDHATLEGFLTGQGFTSEPITFESSVNVHNLALLEDRLKKLKSPLWPEDVLGPLDKERVERGEHLFDRYCSECHAEIDRSDPERRIVAHISSLSEVGTDPTMAKNGATYTGYSGILRNQYVKIGAGDLLIDQKAPIAALLTKATLGVIATPDSDKWWAHRMFDWVYDLVFALRNNEIKPSLKRGNYDPDTTVNPVASLLSYKGRSLNGIWATAPYLHNGSVPSLYDVLLPKRRPGDPPDGEYRPDIFQVGSREFDPINVGYKSKDYEGFTYRTEISGNSNAGHEYGARTLMAKDGTVRPALTKEERLDLVEYLKSL